MTNAPTKTHPAQAVVALLVTALVQFKAAASVVVDPATGSIISVTVDDRDFGKVIGANGATVDALKTIARQIGEFHGEPVTLAVEDAKTHPATIRPKFVEARNWDKEPLRQMVEKVARAMFGAQAEVTATDYGRVTACVITGISPLTDSKKKELGEALKTVFFAIGKVIGRSEVVVGFPKQG